MGPGSLGEVQPVYYAGDPDGPGAVVVREEAEKVLGFCEVIGWTTVVDVTPRNRFDGKFRVFELKDVRTGERRAVATDPTQVILAYDEVVFEGP